MVEFFGNPCKSKDYGKTPGHKTCFKNMCFKCGCKKNMNKQAISKE
jgi:hypothetical protein